MPCSRGFRCGEKGEPARLADPRCSVRFGSVGIVSRDRREADTVIGITIASGSPRGPTDDGATADEAGRLLTWCVAERLFELCAVLRVLGAAPHAGHP